MLNLLETPTNGEIWVNGELIQMKMNRQGESVPVSEKQVQRIRSRLADGVSGLIFGRTCQCSKTLLKRQYTYLVCPKLKLERMLSYF